MFIYLDSFLMCKGKGLGVWPSGTGNPSHQAGGLGLDNCSPVTYRGVKRSNCVTSPLLGEI